MAQVHRAEQRDQALVRARSRGERSRVQPGGGAEGLLAGKGGSSSLISDLRVTFTGKVKLFIYGGMRSLSDGMGESRAWIVSALFEARARLRARPPRRPIGSA